MPPTATPRSRRRCSTASAAASSSATPRRRCRKAPVTAQQLQPENTLKDLAAALAVVRNSGRSGSIGYCWGGTMSYLAACQLQVACAVVYYGRVGAYLTQKPRCPVLYHFGAEDKSIPLSDVDAVRAAYPQAPVYVYEAPVTASTATSAAATTRRPQRWRAAARSSSVRATCAATRRPRWRRRTGTKRHRSAPGMKLRDPDLLRTRA